MSYSFVPAAVNSLSKFGTSIYVKYTRSNVNQIVVKEFNFKYIWLVCPDRELVFVKNNQPLFHPMGENFDEHIDLNVFNDDVCNELDLDIYMINYNAYGPTSKSSPRARRVGRNPNAKQPHILADSGGFQLFSGVKSYIDPLDVIAWYNDNVDWGMVLDVPPIRNGRPNFGKRSALIQRKNVELMLAN